MKNYIKTGVLFAAIICSWFFIAHQTLADDKIYISQIQTTGGTGKTSEDFVEVFNPNVNPFNLKGYRLVKRSASSTTDTLIKSWTADTFIPAQSFYLWANSNFTGISKTPDTTTSVTISDDNGIALRQGSSDTGTIIDSAAWGVTNNIFAAISSTNPGSNDSLLRLDLYHDGSSFSIASSSPRNTMVQDATVIVPPAATSTPTSTPATVPASTPVNTNPPVGNSPVPDLSNSSASGIIFTKNNAIKITEIFPNPSGDDSGKEQVELFNTSGDAIFLTGWLLDDKSEGGVKASAYKLDNLVINPGEYKVITIPPHYFALNNTGGDALGIYYPDKTLADKVSYADDAKENFSYQNVQGVWIWAAPTLGQANMGEVKNVSGNYQVLINEIMPNPAEADEGKEWVELKNASSQSINLKGFIVDDAGNGAAPSGNALVLDAQSTIPGNGFLVITVPEDKFALQNSGGDQVRLFSPDNTLIQTVGYQDAPEGESYFMNALGEWSFGVPTPGAENIQPEKYSLIISELLPNPGDDQNEFIEITNSSSTDAQLKGLKLKVGTAVKTLDEQIILAGEKLVIYEDDLPAHLRNSGGEVSLLNSFGQKISTVNYEKAAKGLSYAFSEGEYFWTELPTPGEENQIIQAASTEVSDPLVKVPKASVAAPKTSEMASVNKVYKEMQKENELLMGEVELLKQQLADVGQKIDSLAQVPQAQAADESAAPIKSAASHSGSYKYLILPLLGIFVLILVVIFKNPFK